MERVLNGMRCPLNPHLRRSCSCKSFVSIRDPSSESLPIQSRGGLPRFHSQILPSSKGGVVRVDGDEFWHMTRVLRLSVNARSVAARVRFTLYWHPINWSGYGMQKGFYYFWNKPTLYCVRGLYMVVFEIVYESTKWKIYGIASSSKKGSLV